jgi:IS5 family transposase
VWEAAAPGAARRARGRDQIDWTRAALDSRSLPAKRGEPRRAEPRRQGQTGLEAALLVEPQGIPLAVEVTAANLHDSRMLAPMLDAVPPIRTGPAGPPPPRPEKLHADKGYDYRRCRDACVRRGIKHRSRARASSRSTTSGATAGSWSARSPGWPATAG